MYDCRILVIYAWMYRTLYYYIEKLEKELKEMKTNDKVSYL